MAEVRACALDHGIGAAHYEHGDAATDWSAVISKFAEVQRDEDFLYDWFCGHRDKAGDLCDKPIELSAAGEAHHESRLVDLEHDPLVFSKGQIWRARAGMSVDVEQVQKTQERRQREIQDQPKPVTEGWYKIGDTIYKVQRAVHRSGNLYAKELVIHNVSHADPEFEKLPEFMKDGRTIHRGTWEYAPGAIRRIRGDQRLSMEECVEFGRLYGVCVRCARTLTKEESIERGMGDVCAGKGI